VTFRHDVVVFVTSPDRPELSAFAGTYPDLMVKISFYDRKLITPTVLVFLKAGQAKNDTLFENT